MKKILDWQKYLDTAVQTVAEGIVMLKNDNGALPLPADETVSVFGRIQLHYYKSGTGSGGMVNVSKVTDIVEGLTEAGVSINSELLEIYRKWDEDNPFDLGQGWGAEPWSQKEMPLDDETAANAAKISETAIVIIGRTAGEEQDARLEEGSYLLTAVEKDMLAKVRKHFRKVVVLLNVGGLIDMSFIDEYSPDSVLYVWQGGMTGGTGTAAVLTGKVSPSGKLPDTIAYSVSDYPSHSCFGNKDRNFYREDVYVGYRWFDTFAREKVRYPFGFGLSYTSFDIKPISVTGTDELSFRFTVRNTGERSGKEVVQLYVEKPQGKLGQPLRQLCGFAKTKELAPNEVQELTITVKIADFASYDDSGVTGFAYSWVLEEGDYNFYAGSDVRAAEKVLTVPVSENKLVKKCVQAMAPVMPFKRVKALADGSGFVPGEEEVPLSAIDEAKRRTDALPQEIPQTGDKGIKLADVCTGKNTLDEFIAQLSDSDLASIIRGEGMGSPRVTPGTASAFGGVTDRLQYYGIPAACCDDGPSGMRLDCGTKAFSLPNGTMIASTFNSELITELFTYMGLEMSANKVECLLGPGINIHRHPLNGRNFEYFSEDPYLTGTMAAAELTGLHTSGVTGTVKHFCCNNQETNRHYADPVVSERALREIYLKGFEMAVKQGKADSIMTTYGPVNGLWTAGNYDLNTTILRNDWGFTGFTMTDWWANVSVRGKKPERDLYAPMAAAQNDVYMVCSDCSTENSGINEALADGTLTRAELQRNAKNICAFIMKSNAMKRLMGTADEITIINRESDALESDSDVVFYELPGNLKIDLKGVKSVKGQVHSFALTVLQPGFYDMKITASSEQSEVAQIPVTVFFMGTPTATFTWNGTGGRLVSFESQVPLFSKYTAARLYFAQNGLDLDSIEFRLVRTVNSMEEAFLHGDE